MDARKFHPSLLFFLFLSFFTYQLQAKPIEQDSQIRYVILLVDYIAGDYKEAVEKPGVIKNKDEYAEMLEFSKLIEKLYPAEKKTSNKVKKQIKELALAIQQKKDKDKVKNLALKLRKQITIDHNLTITLKNHPDFKNGQEVFAKNCASCHGEKGDANSPMAQFLKPPPRNLLEAEFLQDLSPSRVYNTLKVGIPETAMVSYDNILTEKEKWDVSFYVLRLAFKEQKKSQKIDQESLDKLSSTLSWNLLASLSNKDLEKHLSKNLSKQTKKGMVPQLVKKIRANKIGFKSLELNKESPLVFLKKKQSNDESLNFIISKIEEIKKELSKKNSKEIHRDLLSAYLDGFESLEKKLKILDSSLMQNLEKGFMSLRELASHEKINKKEFTTKLATLESDLQKASVLLSPKSSAVKKSPFSDLVASALIILREGLEAFLIIIALLSLVKNLGLPSARKWIHSAWISAIILGFVTFLLIEKVFTLSGANRELLEAFFTILAVIMLFYTGFWLLSQSQKKWTSFITGKSKSELSQGNLWTFFSLAFVAVYREAAETVLFYQALLSTSHNPFMTSCGFVLGVSCLVILCFWIYHYNVRIPLRKFFRMTSFLMFVLSFILIGKASYELIEANYIRQTSLRFIPTLDFLGIYPFVETLVPQALLLALTIALVVKSKAKYSSTDNNLGKPYETS